MFCALVSFNISRSKLMISDLSDTAYRYVLIFNKLVIIFIPNFFKYSLQKNFDLNYNYFHDTNTIGSIVSNLKSIYRFLKKNKNSKKKFINKINLLKKYSDIPFRSKKNAVEKFF